MILGVGAGIGFNSRIPEAVKWALSNDGTDDYIQLPSLTFTQN